MLGSVPKYFGISALAALGVIYHAFSTREQFFPSVYYLSTSKVSIAVLGNFAFAVVLCTYFLLTKVNHQCPHGSMPHLKLCLACLHHQQPCAKIRQSADILGHPEGG